MNIAIILAGGVGTRVGNDIPKQFLKIAGKTLIEHSVEAFENNTHIDEIAIVIHPAFISTVENMVLSNEWRKVRKILTGGQERYESSLAAIRAYTSFPDAHLIFHDAVRPLLNNRIINDVVEALKNNNAVCVAIPTADTIFQVDESGEFIQQILNRNFLRRAQTPQGFKVSVIEKAYEIGLQDPAFILTDDCGVVVRYLPNEKVFVVKGEEFNMKLTYKEDIHLLNALF